jgi:hypothetical protein
MPAPIVLFAYKRAAELSQTLAALKANHLAAETELYVFVDGPRRPADAPKVAAVHTLLDALTGFKAIHRQYSPTNIGCADSIIGGVTRVLQQHPAVIVLEDDIVTSPNFLDYMNQCLDRYADVREVFSVGGYTFPFARPRNHADDVYFFPRTCAWGWGIWADRWQLADWSLADFDAFMADPVARRRFNEGGSDRVRMLERTKAVEIDAWDIRLCYSEFRQNGVTVYPTLSKTLNIGVSSPDSTTEVVYDRYQTPLDPGQQRTFTLPDRVTVNPGYARQFRRKFSVPVRILNKLRTYAMSAKSAITR